MTQRTAYYPLPTARMMLSDPFGALRMNAQPDAPGESDIGTDRIRESKATRQACSWPLKMPSDSSETTYSIGNHGSQKSGIHRDGVISLADCLRGDSSSSQTQGTVDTTVVDARRGLSLVNMIPVQGEDATGEGDTLPPASVLPDGERNDGDKLPLYRWNQELEDHHWYMLKYHTRKCKSLEAHCTAQTPTCFQYHTGPGEFFDSQRRRSPVGADGRIQYWAVPCEHISCPENCPKGETCLFCHSEDEMLYHMAKYKTRVCNGKECRQSGCYFAHTEDELRNFAPAMYSQDFSPGKTHELSSVSNKSAVFMTPESISRSDSVSLIASEDTATSEICPSIVMEDMNEMLKHMLMGSENGDESPSDAELSKMGNEFFQFETFKTIPCDNKSNLHERKSCPYYHSVRDRRRVPVTYGTGQCEAAFEADENDLFLCENGESCDKCHNRLELLYHPEIFKQRFCSTFPKVENCQRGLYCAFAHSRKEIAGKLFTVDEEQQKSDDFYMRKFKTLWCPYGVQHDWHSCIYAHTYQDCRRSPMIGYGSEPCPYWDKNLSLADYEKRCPNGFRCQYAHGSKEQLYHLSYYKTMPCSDWTNNKSCPRGDLCAFFHSAEEQRSRSSQLKYDYTNMLPSNELLESYQPAFNRPPLFTLDDDDTYSRRRRSSYGEHSRHSLGTNEVSSHAPYPTNNSWHSRQPTMNMPYMPAMVMPDGSLISMAQIAMMQGVPMDANYMAMTSAMVQMHAYQLYEQMRQTRQWASNVGGSTMSTQSVIRTPVVSNPAATRGPSVASGAATSDPMSEQGDFYLDNSTRDHGKRPVDGSAHAAAGAVHRRSSADSKRPHSAGMWQQPTRDHPDKGRRTTSMENAVRSGSHLDTLNLQ